jgi:hypothetical protein
MVSLKSKTVSMKFIALIPVLLFSITAIAQDCSEATILQKPGVWKETVGNSPGITPADLAKEKKVVATLHQMIKSKFTPKGVEANINGGYSSPRSWMPVNDYAYSIIPRNYYCDGKTMATAGETSTFFSIVANAFDAEIYIQAEETAGYAFMKDMPVAKDGYWIFKPIDAGLGFGMTGKLSMWLITYDGKLPYAYVTRKAFLEKRKLQLSNEMNEASRGFQDVLANIEIEKGFKEKEYKNDPEKLSRYMKMDYLSTKERYEKLLADNEKAFKPAFAKLESQLKMPVSELSQPAIVKHDPQDHLSYLFTDDNDPFGDILIEPNPAYFNKKLPRSSPQFFWVKVIWNDKEKVASQFTAEILKAVDFVALKSMLGK